MVTIKDVAKRAGVSVTTVSRVLNQSDHPVNEETRQRVVAAIKELGFTPNAMARQLLKNESLTIGVMVPDIANPYYAGIVKGVEDVAQRIGYTTIVCNTDRDRTRTLEYVKVLREKRVDGIILAGGGVVDHAGGSPFVRDQQMRAVLIGKHEMVLPSVEIDNEEASREITEHLISQGRRNFAMVSGSKGSTTAQDRIGGYRRALESSGLSFREELVISGEFTADGGYRAAIKLLETTKPIDAIVAGNDLMAIGVLKALLDRGLRVPGDIAVVGFDNIPIASYCFPPLTTVAVPVYEMGKASMEMLADLIHGEPTAQKKILKASLVIRESCGAKPLFGGQAAG